MVVTLAFPTMEMHVMATFATMDFAAALIAKYASVVQAPGARTISRNLAVLFMATATTTAHVVVMTMVVTLVVPTVGRHIFKNRSAKSDRKL